MRASSFTILAGRIRPEAPLIATLSANGDVGYEAARPMPRR
jgi:hypothetical protein